MSVDHYENFPVASWLCPPQQRPAVSAIYAFARTADDLADEGDASATQRLADLGAYREELQRCAAGVDGGPSARWPQVFGPLQAILVERRLPLPLLTDLLSAFEQDVVKHDYADRNDLLDYCRRSANPVGRLLLHLYGVHQPDALMQSDAICSALQLANFWQDLSVDTARGRLYLPQADCMAHGVAPGELLARQDSAEARKLIASEVAWTRSLMHQGAPLVHTLGGRAGWELRLVVQGGLRILDHIEALQSATLATRPVLRWHDAPTLLWRAWRMHAERPSLAREVA